MPANPTFAPAPSHYALRMWLFFAGYILIGGVYVPFFPVWLAARGLTETEIAACIALPMAIKVFATPFGGVLADLVGNRRLAVQAFTGVAAFIFLFAWPVRSYAPLLLITAAAAVVSGMALPVVEALALTGVRRYGLDYGRMRFGGSVAFVVANLASGLLLGIIAPDKLFFLFLGAMLVAAATSVVLPVVPAGSDGETTRPAARSAWRVLGNPSFLALVFVGGLIQASHAVLYSFGSIHWQSLGFGGAAIGAFWAIGVVSEIVVFMYSGFAIRAFGPAGLILIGGLAAAVRWVALPFDLGLAGFAASQVLHGLTFGAVYLGNQHAIARAVPEELTGSAQGVFAMVQGTLLAGSTALAGPLYSVYGAAAFRFMLVPVGLALVILLAYERLRRRKVPRANR